MFDLSDAQFKVLTALCDTLLPSLEPPPGADKALAAYYRRAASDMNVPRALSELLGSYATPEAQTQFKQLLFLLSSPIGNSLITGQLRPFADLPFETREKILQGWSVSQRATSRQAFQVVKRLACYLYFAALDMEGSNPNWAAVKYPGPNNPSPAVPKPIAPLAINADTTLDCDVVVVGSGAGGGVVASVLAEAGHKVVVLEKGGYFSEADFTRRESHGYRTLYENGAMLTTEDSGIAVFAGSTLGGGTTVNYMTSLRTPDYVLRQWEQEHHLSGLTGLEYQAALDAVSARGHVGTEESHLNRQNQMLWDGCKNLGYHVALIPRNAKGCDRDGCGWCSLGCSFGAKQGTLKTWLQDAVKAGAEIVVNCHADRVLIENNRAVGLVATVTDDAGASRALTVRARVVVVAAGSLHSPALLMRSGVANAQVGLNLHLHPATLVRGEFAEPVEMWSGVMQAAYSDEFANLDGKHYGAKLEVSPQHPGGQGATLPWHSARHYKDMMSRSARQALFFLFVRDRTSGKVTLDRAGRPRIHYRVAQPDARHMLIGIEGALKVMMAAGALEVGTFQSGVPEYRIGNGNSETFEAYLRRVRQTGVHANRIYLSTAHQMGTCRMGGKRDASVIDPTGQSWDVASLYVADASIFPTASGVNPMITIQALAFQTAQHIKARL